MISVAGERRALAPAPAGPADLMDPSFAACARLRTGGLDGFQPAAGGMAVGGGMIPEDEDEDRAWAWAARLHALGWRRGISMEDACRSMAAVIGSAIGVREASDGGIGNAYVALVVATGLISTPVAVGWIYG